MRFTIAFMLAIQLSVGYAADFVVVVSKTSPIEYLESGKLRDVFLKKRIFDGKIKLYPVNVLGEASVRKQFEEKVLGMDRDEINRYWINNHFQGISPPVTQSSLISVKRFVEKVDGAIGYLPRGMVDSELKVLYEF